MLMDIIGGYGRAVLCVDRKYFGYFKSAFYLDEQPTMYDGSLAVDLLSLWGNILHQTLQPTYKLHAYIMDYKTNYRRVDDML